MTFEIQDVRTVAPRASAYSLVFAAEVLPAQPGGVAANVVTDEGTLGVSRLDGETDWTVDSRWTANGLPVFSNGEGARYLATRKVADAEVVAALDAAAEALR